MVAMALGKMIAKITITAAPILAGVWYFRTYGTTGEIPPVWHWVQEYLPKSLLK